MSLLPRIESVLREGDISATRFGRLVSNDPRLVHDMRRGREPGPRLSARILAMIQQLHASHSKPSGDR